MIQIVREVSADVVKRGSTRATYAKQNDLNSRFLNVRIQEDGKDISVNPAATVVLNVERPDKKENMFYGTVREDGTVQVPLTSWMLELEGTLLCDISIISEDVTVAKLTTMQFNIYVEAAVLGDESFVATEDYSVIVDLLDKVGKSASIAEEALQKSNEAIERSEGVQGVYIGSGNMPEGYSVQIDPTGEVVEMNKLLMDGADIGGVHYPAVTVNAASKRVTWHVPGISKYSIISVDGTVYYKDEVTKSFTSFVSGRNSIVSTGEQAYAVVASKLWYDESDMVTICTLDENEEYDRISSRCMLLYWLDKDLTDPSKWELEMNTTFSVTKIIGIC